jgi:hypothetical protein
MAKITFGLRKADQNYLYFIDKDLPLPKKEKNR